MPTGGGPCFLRSIVLGNCTLGNSTVLLRDLSILPRGVPACLALSLAECLTAWGGVELSTWRVPSTREEGELAWESSLSASKRVLSSGEAWELPAWEISLWWKSATYWGNLGTGCLGECTLCQWKSAIFWGSLGTACLGECTLCWWKSAIFWGSLRTACLGTACLGTACLGECTLCWWKSAVYWGSLGVACLGECTLCQCENVVFWGLPSWEISLSANERVLSTGEAWELPAWESCLSAGERVLSPREAWEMPARRNGSWEELFLPGKGEGKHLELPCLPGCCYLPAYYLPGEGPSSWGHLRALPSYTSFLFVY